MRADEIREFINSCPKEEGGTVPKDFWVAELAAQVAELNETLRAQHGDYPRRINNLLYGYSGNWKHIEASAREVLRKVAAVIGWTDYPGKG